MRAATLLAIAIVCTILPFAGQFAGDRAGGWLMVDFRAYYCASLAQREGHNPYFTTSLRSCEGQTPAPYYRPPKAIAVPAPYPPYALAFYYPLTFLPFGLAALLWWTILAVSLAAAAFALSRITAQPLLVGWAALVLSLGLTSWTSGNVVLFAVAALVLAALLAQRRQFAPAAIATIVAMIEPQVALPAAIALFAWYRELRVGLALGAAALAVISIATAGPAQTILYGTTVLPAHALSEVSRDNQYSISTVLAALGVPDASAALAGSLTYIAMTILGIVVGLRLARRYGDAAMAVLVPPAFSLLGGSFVHTGEIAAAVPACLLLFTRATVYRGWLLAALLLLAVPWMLATSVAMFLSPLFPAAYLAYALTRQRPFALGIAAASLAAICGLFFLHLVPAGPMVSHAHAYPPIDPRLAESGWRELVLGNTTNRPIMWLLRLPTWAGLIAFAGAAIALARKAPFTASVSDRLLLESRA